jgi:hypothetical protein
MKHPPSWLSLFEHDARRRGDRGGWNRGRPWGCLLVVAVLFWPINSQALPSFARQTNMSCIVCHTSYPELTSFGRTFKLGGYTLSTGSSNLPPVAIMLQPSFTHTDRSQAGGAAPGFQPNNNFAMTQASFFYAGRILGPYATDLLGTDAAAFANKIGVFIQTTYDGIAKTWALDNTEVRYASTGSMGEHAATFGVYANNNPTMQDPWNSTPAWGYPFTSSGLAPTPAAATLLDGGFAQQVAGAGGYVMFDNTLYLDVAGYHTFGSHLQKSIGVDPTGEAQISGVAPYWRIAWEKPVGNGMIEVGTFGLATQTRPGRDGSAGEDRVTDFGFDSQYQLAFGKNDLSATVSWIGERQNWAASRALGNTANERDTLRSGRLTLHYLRDKTYGLTVQYFSLRGDADALLYAGSASGSPNSAGTIVQLDYLPFNLGGGPAFWPRSNVKISLQYTAYGKFDGARTNYDGAGANARDNNTTYLETWIAF